jgi:hypothetical protein
MKKALMILAVLACVGVGYSQCMGLQGPKGDKGDAGTTLGFYNVRDYGAYGDGIASRHAWMNTGSDTLHDTTVTFVSGDVGKIVRVTDVGRIVTDTMRRLFAPIVDSIADYGQDTIGTISSYVNSHAVRVSFTASATKIGCNMDYGHDDITAIQNAINAAADSGGGRVWIPRATNQYYMLAGSLIHNAGGGTTNCQLFIPCRTTKYLQITIEGEARHHLGSVRYHVSTEPDWAFGGSVLKSIIQGTGHLPTVIGYAGCNIAGFGYTDLVMQNVSFVVPANQHNHGVNLSVLHAEFLGSTDLNRVTIGADHFADSLKQPVDTSFGIWVGRTGTEQHLLRDVNVTGGFMYGIIAGEHSNFQLAQVNFCRYGIVPIGNAYSVNGYAMVQRSNYSLALIKGLFGYTYVGIPVHLVFDLEDLAGTAFPPKAHIFDSLNVGVGLIHYTGQAELVKNGGTNLTCTRN